MRTCFVISTLGLGHATRSLPLIRRTLHTGGSVIVISHGNALAFLRRELSGRSVTFYDLPDYPPIERGRGVMFYFYLLKDTIAIERIRRRETRFVDTIVARHGIDAVISDGRYGGRSRRCPSFLITHQIGFSMPARLKPLKALADMYNMFVFRTFDAILIPDYPSDTANLAGELSRNVWLRFVRHHYVGILSSYPRLDLPEDIDWLFVISGYLTEHKGSFIDRLMDAAKHLPGKKVFALGNTKEDTRTVLDDGTEVYSCITGAVKDELFNRARTVVARAGYTTIMDLVELNKRAVLFPTPNQTEQEYLAATAESGGTFLVGHTEDDLVRLKDADITPFSPPWRTDGSVRRIEAVVKESAQKRFFSIVIPAHNEQAFITGTLQAVCGLDYPADRFEVIVVENGSSDDTLAAAESFAAKGVRVFSNDAPGVSRARNRGVDEVCRDSQWIVFLDADTIIEPGFLRELNHRLSAGGRRVVVGTSAIRPRENASFKARFWFRLYDIGHALTKTSYSMFYARTDIARKTRFDERLHYSEDLKFIRECRTFGGFGFLFTDSVAASSRRFDEVGYMKLFITWMVQAMTPEFMKRGRKYGTVR